ncbi:MAG: trypsin-like serine protease [Actinobacteria bacterium]|nr:trypsin-like serine protease [Actinomycetota bacterium]
MKRSFLKILIPVMVVVFLAMFSFTGCIPKSLRDVAATATSAEQSGPTPQTQASETSAETLPETAETAQAYQLTPKDMIILAQPAVCAVTSYYSGYVYDPNYQDYYGPYYSYISMGTGFCVNPGTGHVVTAAHVVVQADTDLKWYILDQYIYETYPDDYFNLTDQDWNWIYENYKVVGETSDTSLDHEVWIQFNTATSGVADSANAAYMRAEIVDYSPWEQRDTAILRIQSVTGGALSGVLVGDSSMMEIQDDLSIIGYPWTSEVGQDNIMNPTVTTGRISGGKIMLGGTEVLQVQGDARPGNSGGPVLNATGAVIGMLTMGTDETNNYLRPANDIKEILNRNGVQNALGVVDEEFKQGIIQYRMGNYQEAINHFNAVLNLNQKHLLAQDYRSKAQSGATTSTTTTQ